MDTSNNSTYSKVKASEYFGTLLSPLFSATTRQERFNFALAAHRQFKEKIRVAVWMARRVRPLIPDKEYEKNVLLLLEAVSCSESVHRLLCESLDAITHVENKTHLQRIIEQWADTHLSVWKIVLKKGFIE